jgi:hypothetical protein
MSAFKYDGTNPLEKLHEGEPYFLIRAQDVYAPAAVQSYASISERHKEIHPIVQEFLNWQKANPDKVKKPD